MTYFNKANFHYHAGFLTYGDSGAGVFGGKFVARFKYAKADKAGFQSFLIKNFTVEEYFAALEDRASTPVAILQSKGYVSATVKKACIRSGYAPTMQGFDLMIKAQVAAHQARAARLTLNLSDVM